MTTLQRIRKETDMTARDAIRIHAEQGCSKPLTAATIGISRMSLYRICKRFDLDKYFKPQHKQVEGCKQTGGRGKPRISTRAPMLHDGAILMPDDVKHAELFDRLSKPERIKKIHNARKLLTV